MVIEDDKIVAAIQTLLDAGWEQSWLSGDESDQRTLTESRDAALRFKGLMPNSYPDDWPRCPGCGAPALDGHITCGDVRCDEGGRR